MLYTIGVDIGGTKVAIGVVESTGKVIEQSVIPTDLTITPYDMISRINREVNKVIQNANIPTQHIKGIGIGAPGPLDSKKGMITCPPNLPTWRDIPIKEWVEKEFDFPVRLENDANAAALAEKWIGAGQSCNHFIYMTVSTGIGSGIICDGKLLRGRKGNAGDIGHMVVDPSFGTCTCGQKGCLEMIASGTAISREGSKITGESLSTEEVFQLYDQGHPEIVPYLDSVIKVLGVACVSLINTFDTEKIIIGGGVSKVGVALFQPIRSYVQSYALNPDGRTTEIVPSKLEQNSGVVGAAALWIPSVMN
ncbi:ROK family protein [Ornithinibacillus gellani]|uniref:ROK family protein n=1 Tax=Ornithinibacillus gellani TaxID=2293253 RepID=UPI000F46EF01|nr:ROK family protein [Ornithinibacillus gellani]TQS74263.1 ROK family protein [Ornithinibacillus gellani]